MYISILLWLLLARVHCVPQFPDEITVHTPEGENILLDGYNSHLEFFTNMQQLLTKKVRAATESWLRYTKLNSDTLLANIDANQYLFLQLLHSLISGDVTFTNQLLEQSSKSHNGQRPILQEWVKSNLTLPRDVMYRVVKSVANAESLGILKIPQSIVEEILLLTNKSEIFLESCKKGDSKVVQWLLKSGIDLDMSGPLEIAWENEKWDAVKILVRNGALKSIKSQDKFKNNGNGTLLHIAASANSPEAVELLLEQDSSIYDKNNLGLTPLHTADQSGIFHIVKYLLHHNVRLPNVITSDPNLFPYMFFLSEYGLVIHEDDPKQIESYCEIAQLMNRKASRIPFEKELKTKLLELVIKNKILFLTQCLINLGGDLSVTNRNNETLLFNAVREGSYDIVRLLLNEGISVNAKDLNGTTALHVAAGSGKLDIVSLLLKRGADIDAVSTSGYTALHTAAREGHVEVVDHLLGRGIRVDIIRSPDDKTIYQTPLQLAASKGHLTVVEKLLNRGLFNDFRTNEAWNTIHAAAKSGHDDVVKLLLDKGFNVNVVDKEGKTPLFWAAYRGSAPTVMTLLQRGADLHTRSNTISFGHKFGIILKSGETPLHAAAWNGHKDICKILTDRGIEKNIQDAVRETPLYNAALRGHYGVAKFLLEIKAAKNLNTINGTTALHAAAAEGHLDIIDLLFDKGMDIDITNNFNLTPLYSAAQSGRLHAVKHLISLLAEVDAANYEGQTPLTAAVMGGHYDTALYLLEKGANVDVTDHHGNTLMMEAVTGGFEDIIKLLKGRGAWLNLESKRSDGFTPLHIAAKGDPKIFQLLLDMKAHIDAKAADGTTPLFEAIRSENEAVVKIILDSGYQIDTNNTRNDDNSTCLHYAVIKDSKNMVQLLLEKEAYINPVDKYGDTPLHLAINVGSFDIARMLLDRGADVNIKNSEGLTPLQFAKKTESKKFFSLRLCDCKAQ